MGQEQSTTCIEASSAKVALGCFLILATPASYAPQVIKIWRKRSHEGLSYPQIVGGVVCTALIVVSFTTTHWYELSQCCGDNSDSMTCASNWLPFIQLLSILISAHAVMFAHAFYYSQEYQDMEDSRLGVPPGTGWSRTWRIIIATACFEVVVLASTIWVIWVGGDGLLTTVSIINDIQATTFFICAKPV